MLFTLLSAFLFNAGISPGATCALTIPQLVERQRPQPVERHKTYELVAMDLDEVIAASEVVIEGTVVPTRTYLSPDECTVLTDYAITVRQLIRGQLPKTSRHGELFTVTTEGGDMTVNGVSVIVRDEQLPPFERGQNVVLLLSRGVRDANVVYGITAGHWGAFEVSGGRVRHLLRNAGSGQFQEMDHAAFVARVKRR